MFKISKVLFGWTEHDLFSLSCNGANCNCRCAWNAYMLFVHEIEKNTAKQVPKSAWVDSNKIHFINNTVQDRRYIIIIFKQYWTRQSQY